MGFERKIMDLESAVDALSDLRLLGNRVVFTNGCFDILHLGHITYLQKAKSLGDILVVGLNSDTSVARLKGDDRPIKNEQSRAAILAALESVDIVIIFDNDTPFDMIASIKPHVLAKGGDYTKAQIVGADITEGNGGTVAIIPFVEGHSSTTLIDKMNK